MKKLLLLTLLLHVGRVQAQSDLLVLKQRGHIIQTWIRGGFFSFQFVNKQQLQGWIKDIRNDSLLLDIITLRSVITQFGVPGIDTGRGGLLKFHVKEIYALPKRKQGGEIFTDGTLLKVGSGGYMFLNIFNSLIHNDPVFGNGNLRSLGIAAGIFGVGVLLSLSHKNYVVLGKKYTVEVLHTAVGN